MSFSLFSRYLGIKIKKTIILGLKHENPKKEGPSWRKLDSRDQIEYFHANWKVKGWSNVLFCFWNINFSSWSFNFNFNIFVFCKIGL